jgi:hypothetical protein
VQRNNSLIAAPHFAPPQSPIQLSPPALEHTRPHGYPRRNVPELLHLGHDHLGIILVATDFHLDVKKKGEVHELAHHIEDLDVGLAVLVLGLLEVDLLAHEDDGQHGELLHLGEPEGGWGSGHCQERE